MNNIQKILLSIQYQGSGYHGWQKQPETQKTIQSLLEQALYKRSGVSIATVASGRTDAGVHARRQAVCFEYAGERHIDLDDWVKGVNVFLPEDIKVLSAQYVKPSFHVIAHVKKKAYRYFFRMDRQHNIFLKHCVTQFPEDVNITLLKKAGVLFKGEHDFKSFQTSSDPQKTTVRTVFDLSIHRVRKTNIYYCEVIGSGFLKHMVRNIMGAMIAVGRKKASLKDLKKALQSEEKIKIGSTAPPEGLFLWDIQY